MQNIQKELKLARAELAAIEATNKEAAIAAAFKRTATKNERIKALIERIESLNEEDARLKDEQLALRYRIRNVAKAYNLIGEGPTERRRQHIHSMYVEVDAISAKRCELMTQERFSNEEIASIKASFEPVLQSTKQAKKKIAALEAQLPKPPKPEYMTRSERWEHYARINETQVLHGEARIDLIRGRMAKAEAVIPGEANEWLPIDEDEAIETVAWLHTKHDSARDPRRKEHRRHCMTQLDFAKWEAGNKFPAGKRGRYWGRDTYWYEGYEARARAAEAAAWER